MALTPPLGLTLQGRHHGLAQRQHQAQRGAEEKEAGDLEVQAGSADGALRSLRGGSGWTGGCACPPGLPRGGGSCGGHLQAVGEGCSVLLPQQPSTDPGGEGAGRSPVLGALRFRIGHVAGGALGGQGRGFWAAPAQPLHPICQGVLYWADFRGEQLIVLEGTGDRKSLGTRRCGFYLFGSEERGLDAGQGVKASGRAEPWRGQSEAAEDTTQGTEVMLRGQSPRDGETPPSPCSLGGCCPGSPCPRRRCDRGRQSPESRLPRLRSAPPG